MKCVPCVIHTGQTAMLLSVCYSAVYYTISIFLGFSEDLPVLTEAGGTTQNTQLPALL